MISPSSFPAGTPGQSGRNAQSSYSGVVSMCDTTSGVSNIDNAATWNGWVCTMQLTSGRAR